MLHQNKNILIKIFNKNSFVSGLLSVFAIFPVMAHTTTTPYLNVAIYRGEAGCPGCSEMVAKSLKETGLVVNIFYIGENEVLKLNKENLINVDLYIQPGGGQDIPGAYRAIGETGARAIRDFVKNGKGYLGLCMGAYLADDNWLKLIDSPLDSEVGRPESRIYDESDYTIPIKWGRNTEAFYYQDGPYFDSSVKSKGYVPLAYYGNGDVAMAKYNYGKGTVVLSGPHPEADDTWKDSSAAGYSTPQSKMLRILGYFPKVKQ